MATETKPAWVRELRQNLTQPRTPERQARIDTAIARLQALNAGKTWPAGASQRLMDLADQEDAADEQSYLIG